jgi:LysR family hydrogen peroxide-inducible transcriptional activator
MDEAYEPPVEFSWLRRWQAMNIRSRFSLTQLEYVVAVFKAGHFAKAAAECGVTQPTLSMQIQKLEEDLGVVIFDRSKKPILLTSAGKKIIEQIQTLLFDAKRLDELVLSDQSDAISGDLVIGVIPTIAPYVLPQLLPVIEKKFPEMRLKILELQTHRIIEALGTDEIDVGLLATPIKIPKIFEYPLFYEPFFVYSRKDHELAKKSRVKYSNLKFDDIWLLEEGHCLRHQVLDVCAIKGDSDDGRRFTFESGSLETLKSIVSSYGGYTLLPQLATTGLRPNTELIPFERPIPAREIGLVYRREHYKSKMIEALGESILESIPAEVRKLRRKDLDVIAIE